MPRPDHEFKLHCVILDYLRACLPFSAGKSLHHCPNGENRARKTGARLRRMGVKPGWPDLGFIWAGVFHGIEVKTDNDPVRGIRRTYQNQDQKECQRSIEAAGGLYAVCRSLDDVRATLRGWGVPVLETGRWAASESRGAREGA